jgi:hypothetical protein
MFKRLNKTVLAIPLALSGAWLLTAPALFDATYDPGAVLGGAVIGTVLILAAVGIAYGSLDFWSRFALGLGTWALVAPILFGFYDGGPSFWSHIAAGLTALLVGVAGHDLLVRQQADHLR